MRRILLSLCFVVAAQAVLAQGLVNFWNSPTTLVSYQSAAGFLEPIPATPGQFYFGLFLGPYGTTDPLAFSFTGRYATNITSPGIFSGGAGIAVPGWPQPQYEPRSYLVHGWSADLGHDWNPEWVQGVFPGGGSRSVFGTSGIGTAFNFGTNIIPFNLFGSQSGINSGFTLDVVPEPFSSALLFLGIANLLLWRKLLPRP
jgi:hypothetical protein